MKKVLIVEDDTFVSRMYGRAFKLDGYETEFMGDGEEALNRLKTGENLPSVILMDIAMPKMDGYSLLEKIKQDDRLKNIPVAVLTNSATEGEARRFMEIGADLYLIKIQHSSKELVQKINTLVAEKSGEKSKNKIE
jgi:CheY-like chemotaxis protein